MFHSTLFAEKLPVVTRKNPEDRLTAQQHLKHLLGSLDKLTDWEVPLNSFNVRCLVKAYDSANIKHPKFKNNLLGPDWVHSFIKCHNLTKRITDNVKAARAEVNAVINTFFNNLSESISGIPPERIYNYDESDDPGTKTDMLTRKK